MGTTASSCIQTRCFQSSLSFSLPPVCLMLTVKDLPTLLHLHHPLHLSTQHHLQFSIIIQTLARPMLGATASTRTPTATRWRRSSSRTSASHTLRRPAGHKTRRLANRNCSKTAPGSLRPISSVSASMWTSWSVTLWRLSTMRRSRRLTRSRGALQGRTGCATPLTTLTPPPRMTTSAATWRLPIATWRKIRSTMSPAPIQSSSTARGRRRQRTTDMDKRSLCVRGPPSRIAITFLERSKSRYASPMSTGTAKSSPNIFPFPVEKQNCHFEPKKICELEMKTRSKKAKKYSYTKDCKEQPREICDQCEKKSIKPVCDTQDRLTCKYIPKEQCQDEDKQYCHKVEKVVLEEVCDMKFDTRYL